MARLTPLSSLQVTRGGTSSGCCPQSVCFVVPAMHIAPSSHAESWVHACARGSRRVCGRCGRWHDHGRAGRRVLWRRQSCTTAAGLAVFWAPPSPAPAAWCFIAARLASSRGTCCRPCILRRVPEARVAVRHPVVRQQLRRAEGVRGNWPHDVLPVCWIWLRTIQVHAPVAPGVALLLQVDMVLSAEVMPRCNLRCARHGQWPLGGGSLACASKARLRSGG